MFNLESQLRALEEGRVEYVVIGGVAVGAHGYIRATEDLDIVPDPSPENQRRLAEVLGTLGATLPTAGDRHFDPADDLAALQRGENVTAETPHGGLDIVQRAKGLPGYEALARESEDAELLGVQVSICSLTHLRQMKSAAARSQDRADLDNLPEP